MSKTYAVAGGGTVRRLATARNVMRGRLADSPTRSRHDIISRCFCGVIMPNYPYPELPRTFVDALGIRTAYYAAGAAGGRPVVFLHGMSTSADSFRESMHELAGTFWLLAPDIPGFGHSDNTDPYTCRTWWSGWLPFARRWICRPWRWSGIPLAVSWQPRLPCRILRTLRIYS